MAGKSKDSSANRTYTDIQPLTSCEREEQADVVVINLPGFEKQQLKILLDSRGKMMISGERPESGNRWQRFRFDLQVDQACDLNAIRAKLVKGILTVTMPRKIPAAATPSSAPHPETTQDAQRPLPRKDSDAAAAAADKPTPPSALNHKTTQDSQPPVRKDAAEERTKSAKSNGTAKEPPVQTPEEAAGTLACEYRPESRKHGGGIGSFVYGLNRPKRVAMGVMVAASLVAGIYAIYKFKIFQPETGE